MWTEQISWVMVIQPAHIQGLIPNDMISSYLLRLTLEFWWIGSVKISLENNRVIIYLTFRPSDCGVMCLLFIMFNHTSFSSTLFDMRVLVFCQNLCVLSLKAISIFVVFRVPFLKADAYMEIAKMLAESSKTAKRWRAFAQLDSYCVRPGNIRQLFEFWRG